MHLPIAELALTSPDGNIVRHKLAEKTVLGRHPACDIVMTDPMCSRRHCLVEREADGRIYITDCHSANGTQLNGCRIQARAQIKKGDILVVGATLAELVLREGKTVFIVSNKSASASEVDTVLKMMPETQEMLSLPTPPPFSGVKNELR